MSAAWTWLCSVAFSFPIYSQPTGNTRKRSAGVPQAANCRILNGYCCCGAGYRCVAHLEAGVSLKLTFLQERYCLRWRSTATSWFAEAQSTAARHCFGCMLCSLPKFLDAVHLWSQDYGADASIKWPIVPAVGDLLVQLPSSAHSKLLWQSDEQPDWRCQAVLHRLGCRYATSSTPSKFMTE